MSINTWEEAWDNDVRVIGVVNETKAFLNECYEPICFGNLCYEPADVLESVDLVAFKEVSRDLTDMNLKDGIWVELDDGTVVDAKSYHEAIKEKEEV